MTTQGVAMQSSLPRPMPLPRPEVTLREWLRMLLTELLCWTSNFWPE